MINDFWWPKIPHNTEMLFIFSGKNQRINLFFTLFQETLKGKIILTKVCTKTERMYQSGWMICFCNGN